MQDFWSKNILDKQTLTELNKEVSEQKQKIEALNLDCSDYEESLKSLTESLTELQESCKQKRLALSKENTMAAIGNPGTSMQPQAEERTALTGAQSSRQ